MRLRKFFKMPLFYIDLIAIALLVLLVRSAYMEVNLASNTKQSLNSLPQTPQTFYFNTHYFNTNPTFPNGVYQPRTPEPDPNIIPIPTSTSWKMYQSKKIGYEIQIPPGWHGGINENENDLFKMNVSPEVRDGLCLDTVWIEYPFIIQPTIQQSLKNKEKFYDNSLPGIEKYYQEKTAQHGTLSINHTQIDNKPTLVVTIKDPKPQEGFQGEWCDGDSKGAFVQLGENTIFSIFANWDKDTIYNTEKMFDQMLTKLKFF